MAYKNTRMKKLENLNAEILDLFKKNPKLVFLTRQVQISIETKTSHHTIKSYLEELANKGKIKKIQSGVKNLWQKK